MTDKDFIPKSFGIGSFQITFYALFILLGAILALVISQHRVKKQGYNPKDLENLFLVAFPLGLVGARLWYCIFQWHEFYHGNFWEAIAGCFGFVDGKFEGLAGLAIQGGVILGVVSGILFLHKYRKHMKILDVADAAVPTILVAQAIGRVGNFINREVYGYCVDSSNWSWLGNWFVKQMSYDGVTNKLICDSPNQMALPLCLIEALINIAGFIILSYGITRLVKGKELRGVVTFSYFIWYGLTRVILEPLRNEKFIMSVNDSGIPTSRITAIVFMVVGALLVGLVFLNRYYLSPKGKGLGKILAEYSNKFNSLPRWAKILIEAIPVSGWFNAIFYRLSKDNFTCGVLCIVLGPIFWIIDLVTMIIYDKIIIFAQGEKLKTANNVETNVTPSEENKEEDKDE